MRPMRPTRDDGSSVGKLGQPTVVFRLAEARYGIDCRHVDEVVRVGGATVCDTQGLDRGHVDIRGESVPVVDLRARLNITGATGTPNSLIIVVLGEGRRVGIVVDAVTEVTQIQPDDVDESFALIDGRHVGYTRGLATRNGSPITLLDLDKALVG